MLLIHCILDGKIHTKDRLQIYQKEFWRICISRFLMTFQFEIFPLLTYPLDWEILTSPQFVLTNAELILDLKC